MTQAAIGAGADVIYEATFCYDDLLFKADILRRTSAGWELYEVKAATAAKAVYIEDIAFQVHILRGLGVKLVRAHLMHINNQYIRQGDIDISKLFAVAAVSSETDALQPELTSHIATMRRVMAEDIPPNIDIGPHCNDPYSCDFSPYCWQHVPSPSVFDFARIGKKAFDLYNHGILRMEEVPLEELNDKQIMQAEAWKHQKDYIKLPELRQFLDSLHYPICFMDFETFATPVPLYDGVRPYQQIPFQYSLHALTAPTGMLRQHEYLADGAVNPQQSFIESLLEAVPPEATVLVWNATFERQRLQELMQAFPDKSPQIQRILDNIVDLMLPFQQRYIYRAGFQGSYSIKKVLPYMVDTLSYQALEINNGIAATTAWLQMRSEPQEQVKEGLRQQLLAYCRMDTYAMVKILEKMQEMAHLASETNVGVMEVTQYQDVGMKTYGVRAKEGMSLAYSSSKEAVSKYFSELQFRMDIYDQAQKDMDAYVASSFNVFEYINPNENKLSDIIADLLNPQGKHGQKDTFLQLFMDLLKVDCPYELTSCRILREISTAYIANNQRRMDIALRFDGKFAIVIENKPWDTEQENQLQDYQEHLTKKYGENFCLVYLTGDGSPPVSITPELKEKLKAEGKLVVLNYAEDLLSWLEHCYKECQAEKIRNFLKDFMKYIDRHFENSYDDDDDGEAEEDGE